MSSLKILYHAIRFRLRDLPFKVDAESSQFGKIVISVNRSVKWKQKPFGFQDFANLLGEFGKISATELVLSDLPRQQWRKFLSALEDFADLIAKDNLQDLGIWGKFPMPHATGFTEGTLPQSNEFLSELYADKFVVPEKKKFVIDLRRSFRTHLISVDEAPKSFMDAAAQIGSLALGYNDPEKKGILTHPEHYDWKTKASQTEVYGAFKELLRAQSGLPHAYFFNSGAEANEAAIQLCLNTNPTRKKIMAFSGSFHGRSFLTLHLTHSPTKRLPFETFPDLVTFAPFPETKIPGQRPEISTAWKSLWASPEAKDFDLELKKIKEDADPLMVQEIESLLFLKAAFAKEKFLAAIIEPRQCEGGDRYATRRFYHALRLLTRAYEIPLIFDEVQTGFGLGGPFFWHHQYGLQKTDGELDTPDCITFAKKGQVAGVLSRFSGDMEEEVNSASLHRGYLQAMSTVSQGPVDFSYVEKKLKELQALVGNGIISYPRGQAQNFAFDLPSSEILNKLISYRFAEGILFYPAGEQTARFRLIKNFTHQEIDGLFTSLYRCFLKGAEEKIIPAIPPLESWLEKIPKSSHGQVAQMVPLVRENPWSKLPKTTEELRTTSVEAWKLIFVKLLKEERTCFELESNRIWTLEKLSTSSLDDLIGYYQSEFSFSWLDLIWQASRLLGWKVEQLTTPEQLGEVRQDILGLQTKIYETARRTPFEDFQNCLTDNKGLVLAVRENSRLIGIAACDSIRDFTDKKLVDEDPLNSDPHTYYSVDVTVDPAVLGAGLGLRLKCEQIMELMNREANFIRSRNRFPEAAAMIKLNHGFGSLVIRVGQKIYEDGGDAFYQSLRLTNTSQKVWNPRHPSMLTKGSLANFVSPAYIDNLLILKELLPAEYRHVYLASGRPEALDKAIKCFRHFRPQGKLMVGVSGNYFGKSTAASVALSGGHNYFDWPLFKPGQDGDFENWVKKISPEQILGAALAIPRNFSDENISETKNKLEILQKLKIPTVLNESHSSFWRGGKDFLLSGSLLFPDAIYFDLGPQVAALACREAIFIDKPLALISTWDGDEHGLCLFQDRMLEILEELPEVKA